HFAAVDGALSIAHVRQRSTLARRHQSPRRLLAFGSCGCRLMEHDADDLCLTSPRGASCLPGINVGLYLTSFFVPVMHNGFYGSHALLCALLVLPFWPLWLANAVMVFGIIFLFGERWREARKAGLWALALALSESWLFWNSVRVGYFMWIGSMALLAIVG